MCIDSLSSCEFAFFHLITAQKKFIRASINGVCAQLFLGLDLSDFLFCNVSVRKNLAFFLALYAHIISWIALLFNRKGASWNATRKQ